MFLSVGTMLDPDAPTLCILAQVLCFLIHLAFGFNGLGDMDQPSEPRELTAFWGL